MKAFLIDFSNHGILEKKIPKNIQLKTEKNDGGLAYKKIGEIIPDIILINCGVKPSHALNTALAIRKRKKTSQLPILLVDVPEEKMDIFKMIGRCISLDEIDEIIQNINR